MLPSFSLLQNVYPQRELDKIFRKERQPSLSIWNEIYKAWLLYHNRKGRTSPSDVAGTCDIFKKALIAGLTKVKENGTPEQITDAILNVLRLIYNPATYCVNANAQKTNLLTKPVVFDVDWKSNKTICDLYCAVRVTYQDGKTQYYNWHFPKGEHITHLGDQQGSNAVTCNDTWHLFPGNEQFTVDLKVFMFAYNGAGNIVPFSVRVSHPGKQPVVTNHTWDRGTNGFCKKWQKTDTQAKMADTFNNTPSIVTKTVVVNPISDEKTVDDLVAESLVSKRGASSCWIGPCWVGTRTVDGEVIYDTTKMTLIPGHEGPQTTNVVTGSMIYNSYQQTGSRPLEVDGLGNIHPSRKHVPEFRDGKIIHVSTGMRLTTALSVEHVFVPPDGKYFHFTLRDGKFAGNLLTRERVYDPQKQHFLRNKNIAHLPKTLIRDSPPEIQSALDKFPQGIIDIVLQYYIDFEFRRLFSVELNPANAEIFFGKQQTLFPIE